MKVTHVISEHVVKSEIYMKNHYHHSTLVKITLIVYLLHELIRTGD